MGIQRSSKILPPLAGAIIAVVAFFTTPLFNGTVASTWRVGIALICGVGSYLIARRLASHLAKKRGNSSITAEEVFPTTGTPKYNYQKRSTQEDLVSRYRDHGTGLLSVYGPTKAGKSVMVTSLMPKGLYIRGDVDTAESLWAKAITEASAYTGRSHATKVSTTTSAGVTGMLINTRGRLSAKADLAHTRGSEKGKSVEDDRFLVIQSILLNSGRALIIDDFHFMPRSEQRKVMAALKGLIDRGGRAVVITATHRAHRLSSLVPNMGGRFAYVEVKKWDHEDLVKIAVDGFAKLQVTDPNNFASELAANSFGSPQLMQRLSLQLCKENLYLIRQPEPATLAAPQGSWGEFYTRGLNRMGAEIRWLQKLKRGPQERRGRLAYKTRDNQELDGYELIRVAFRALLPKMDLLRDQIHDEVSSLLTQQPTTPRSGETTAKLKQLHAIARQPLDQDPRFEDEDHSTSGDDDSGVEPVLEYEDSGPSSTVRIVDPLYAFALRWWQED
ncbi:TniB family NTP-binding protein [Specibacter sp. NPDC078692]|uniref:TniB family NTP-binding protein n=1 Tax=Specibacter sp. NPDC078692 TaxID=3155818 RepID=UPI0034190A03